MWPLPKTPQGAPKRPPRAPRRPQEAPNGPQEGPQDGPKSGTRDVIWRLPPQDRPPRSPTGPLEAPWQSDHLGPFLGRLGPLAALLGPYWGDLEDLFRCPGHSDDRKTTRCDYVEFIQTSIDKLRCLLEPLRGRLRAPWACLGSSWPLFLAVSEDVEGFWLRPLCRDIRPSSGRLRLNSSARIASKSEPEKREEAE